MQWTQEERDEMLRRRAEASAIAPALSGMLSSFVSTGESRTTETGSSEEFSGSKDGYVFKMGRFGLGYYEDKGPNGPFDDYDVNQGMVIEKKVAYDIEKHARGELQPEPPKEPGHGRVGTLGELLAENKQKKQEDFDALVHANRFQPTKAVDDDEAAFLEEKAAERREAERARKEEERRAETEYRLALAKQSQIKEDTVDLAKIMGQAKPKKTLEQTQSKILSRMVKRKVDDCVNGDANKHTKQDAYQQAKGEEQVAAEASTSLLGLAEYNDSDEES